jgi:hypothetical protein
MKFCLLIPGHLLGLLFCSLDGGISSHRTSLNFYQTTRCNIPEDSSLQILLHLPNIICHGNPSNGSRINLWVQRDAQTNSKKEGGIVIDTPYG